MPRGDGTGPCGMGSGTGRALGYCSGAEAAGFAGGPGRGGRCFGQGRGGFGQAGICRRGMGGRGGRRGSRMGAGLESEREDLLRRATAMESSLAVVKARLARLDEEGSRS